MTGAPRRLVGRNYGGARSRHRWWRWWVSPELHAASILAISGALIPLAVSRRALAALATSTFRGRPPLQPFAAAGASPCTGPLDHCVSLELSECGHDRKHGLSHRAVRVESLCDATETDSTFRQMFDELKNVNHVAPQPIQLPHYEHVTVTEVIRAPIHGSLRRDRLAQCSIRRTHRWRQLWPPVRPRAASSRRRPPVRRCRTPQRQGQTAVRADTGQRESRCRRNSRRSPRL
jgi:hypothetical protein